MQSCGPAHLAVAGLEGHLVGGGADDCNLRAGQQQSRTFDWSWLSTRIRRQAPSALTYLAHGESQFGPLEKDRSLPRQPFLFFFGRARETWRFASCPDAASASSHSHSSRSRSGAPASRGCCAVDCHAAARGAAGSGQQRQQGAGDRRRHLREPDTGVCRAAAGGVGQSRQRLQRRAPQNQGAASAGRGADEAPRAGEQGKGEGAEPGARRRLVPRGICSRAHSRRTAVPQEQGAPQARSLLACTACGLGQGFRWSSRRQGE